MYFNATLKVARQSTLGGVAVDWTGGLAGIMRQRSSDAPE
jgi:hypothetical protein